MESWRKAWRTLILPLLCRYEVELLYCEFAFHDAKNIEFEEICVAEGVPGYKYVTKADPVAFCLWQGRKMVMYNELITAYARLSDVVTARGSREVHHSHFFGWFESKDSREQVVKEFTKELEYNLNNCFANTAA